MRRASLVYEMTGSIADVKRGHPSVQFAVHLVV